MKIKDIFPRTVSRKQMLIISSAILLFLLFLLIFFKIYFIASFSSVDLKRDIADFFKETLNRAVKFEEATIDYAGNIQVKDFCLSVSSDFNDNINMIKSAKTIIKLDFFKLLSKKIVVREIVFADSEFTFKRSHTKNYSETLKNMENLWASRDKIEYLDLSSFRISLINSGLYYFDVIGDNKLLIECSDVNAKAVFSRDNISFRVKGDIKRNLSKKIGNGSFFTKGKFDPVKKILCDGHVEVDNFDLSYLNDYLKEWGLVSDTIRGGFSADLKISNEEKLKAKGSLEISNLSIFSREPERINLISNDDIEFSGEFEAEPNFTAFTLKKAVLSDDAIRIKGQGGYESASGKLTFDFSSNKINLGKLSDYLTPFQGIIFSGVFLTNGTIACDPKNMNFTGSILSAKLEDGEVTSVGKGKKKKMVTDCDFTLNLKDNIAILDLSGDFLRSDAKAQCRTKITAWNPFQSDSEISLAFKNLRWDALSFLGSTSLDGLYEAAYADKKHGFEDVNFQQRPAGKFLSANNAVLKLSADHLILDGKSSLSDLRFMLALKNGFMNLSDFNLAGYDARYSLTLQGQFNTESAFLTFKAGAADFNIEKFWHGTGRRGQASGSAGFDLSYEIAAYRLSHLLVTPKFSLGLTLKSGSMKNIDLLKEVGGYLKKQGKEDVSMDTINYETVSLNAYQSGENFVIQNFSVKSDAVNFQSAGIYNYNGGLSIPLNALIADKNGGTFQQGLILKGQLLRPCLSSAQEKLPEVCF